MKGSAQPTSIEKTIFNPGTYDMTLKKIMCLWGKPSKFQPDGAAKIMFIWEYEVEGEKFELADYLGFPKNFAYNDKSNFWKRLGEIAGVRFSSENAETVDLDLGDFIQSYDELVDHLQTKDDQGKNEKADVRSLKVGDQSLIGKKCQLTVKVWEADGKQGNEIAAVLPIGGGAGPRKPGKAAPAPQAAPQQQARPPVRPVAPAPAPQDSGVDMPFDG